MNDKVLKNRWKVERCNFNIEWICAGKFSFDSTGNTAVWSTLPLSRTTYIRSLISSTKIAKKKVWHTKLSSIL